MQEQALSSNAFSVLETYGGTGDGNPFGNGNMGRGGGVHSQENVSRVVRVSTNHHKIILLYS